MQPPQTTHTYNIYWTNQVEPFIIMFQNSGESQEHRPHPLPIPHLCPRNTWSLSPQPLQHKLKKTLIAVVQRWKWCLQGVKQGKSVPEDIRSVILTFLFTFSHLADAFIQSDLQGCIHIFTFTLMAHCTSGAIRGSVSCSRTLRQGIELTTFFPSFPPPRDRRAAGARA